MTSLLHYKYSIPLLISRLLIPADTKVLLTRTMIDHARVTSQNHAFTYDEKIKVESATQAVCDLALRFGESVHDEDAMMSRPFGVALLIAGVDEKGPQLYV